ncbi:MAG: hypothetical protein EBT03_12160 [Betaproteobacteria bacterium]|nr:hypothetical protein [Betaproteobacteria bacterium]
MTNFDGFGDVLEGTSGIFGGSDGLQAYDSVQHQYSPDGLVVQLHCESCGKPRHMTVMWPEICSIKFNVSPNEAYGAHPQMRQYAGGQWMNTASVVSRGVPYAWYPQLRCACGNTIQRPLIRPGECESHLVEARRNRWLPPQAEQAFSQQARAVAQHLGRL